MFTKYIRVFLLLCVAGAVSSRAESSPDAAMLIDRLGDSKLTQDQRDAAAGSLVKLGKDAMPALIGSLHDNRVYFPNYATPSGTNGPSVTVNLTVGFECNYLLMDIASNGASTKVMGFRYRVLNWPDWWSRHKDMTQNQIQKEVKKRNQFILESTGEGDSIPHLNQP